jgi:hypothetical protein
MRAEDHQSQWFTLGGALFVGGLIVNTDWIFAVLSSAPARHLSVLEWPFVLSFVVMFAGSYIMLASYIEKWWLPGKYRVALAAGRRQLAEGELAIFHRIGKNLEYQSSYKPGEVSDWIISLADFVKDAWGYPEQSAILYALKRLPGDDRLSDDELREVLRKVLERLTGLMERCSLVPLRKDAALEDDSSWKDYLLKVVAGQESSE